MKAIVTGGNRGIGLEYCRQLKEKGYQVLALCREASDNLKKLGVEIYENISVTDEKALTKFAAQVDDSSIDLLVNNAGIMRRNTLDALDFASMREQFEVNSIGPLLVTSVLLNKIKKGGKIALMTSRMGSIADNTSGSSYGYRMSKAALNIAGVSLAHDLKSTGIAVAILHPGYVRTDMTGNSGYIDADESVRGLLARIDELSLDNSGTFWHSNGEILPW